MASAHSFSEFKDSKLGEKIALAAALVLPVVGLCCLLFPHQAQKALPYLLGIPMVVSGVSSIAVSLYKRDGSCQHRRSHHLVRAWRDHDDARLNFNIVHRYSVGLDRPEQSGS